MAATVNPQADFNVKPRSQTRSPAGPASKFPNRRWLIMINCPNRIFDRAAGNGASAPDAPEGSDTSDRTLVPERIRASRTCAEVGNPGGKARVVDDQAIVVDADVGLERAVCVE